MGHRKVATTEVYLRRHETFAGMETVRSLSWGIQFEAKLEKATSGFEPLYEALQASA
jgi:hypothetical protein